LALGAKELREAVRLAPANAEIRNDYGYVLMQSRRFADARMELSTAAELAPADVRPRNNLIILMLATGDEAGALRLSEQSGVQPELLARLQRQAQSLKPAAGSSKPAKAASPAAPLPSNPPPSRSSTGKSS
jgi:Flp pilus assembly protein TadD